MKCEDIKPGSYDCAYNIMPPFKCGFSNDFRYVAIDKCLIGEIIHLWEQGIHTTGCCCGHGDINKAFIGVDFEDIPKMKAMGYKVYFNTCRPGDEDSFIPKTMLNYGKIQKGFNWWDENNGEKNDG